MGFKSEIRVAGQLRFPAFTGLRIMMMPVRVEDPETVPMVEWRGPFADLVSMAPCKKGTAYLTIDQALVREGETHRRPGLHVDGIGPDGREAAWGGGGKYASNGMIVAADVVGCIGWNKDFDGYPGPNGDCAHLTDQCEPRSAVVFAEGYVFWCGPLAVHKSMRMRRDQARTFVRLSMPGDCPWYEGYTVNPLGVPPTGQILPARTKFMNYRPGPS